MNTDKNNPRLAVLIDADNTFNVIPVIDALFKEISEFGDASVRRIYGDWTDTRLKRWKEVLPKHAIQPIQQFANTTGKNATDSALIIDAMDLLYSAPLDGFCIVSSDSDFTRLSIRFRESGKLVYGFGEDKTPDSLIAACNKFIYIEILSQDTINSNDGSDSNNAKINNLKVTAQPITGKLTPDESTILKPVVKKTKQELASDTRLVSLIRSAIESLSDEDGYANTGEIKKHITKNYSAFDSRNYGYAKFSDLITTIGLFELDAKKQRIKDKRKK
ncbi:MAG: Maebl [Proteobacteria bacterium ST_bin12]|nr:MAG: Maebl [Proteobacteria bacterium ST_bin12]